MNSIDLTGTNDQSNNENNGGKKFNFKPRTNGNFNREKRFSSSNNSNSHQGGKKRFFNKEKRNFRNRNHNNGSSGSRSHNFQGNRQNQYPTYLNKSTKNWMNIEDYPKYQEGESKNKLKIYTLSGLMMIGTNCTAFEYGNDILIVDAGIGYPDEFLPGVDLLVPNLNYFKDKKEKIRGIIITHGHMDHIGGVHYVIEDLGFPNIYGSRLACEMIKLKLQEVGIADKVKLFVIDGDSSYRLGEFSINHFKMTHTIPDNYGIVFSLPIGRIVISSDYKFDSNPYKEAPSDYAKLAKLGELGVLLLLNESTNARKQGWSDSESEIASDIGTTIREAKGRVMIGMFSTMVNRMRQIVEFSHKYNKKVAVLGRSLNNIVKITHNMGLIDVENGVYIDINDTHKYPDEQIVIIATGSQGEPNSALMRIAEERHNKIRIKQTDTVVFSSSRIPGNENKIDRLIDLFSRKGITVLTNDYLTLHASGHGYKEEHKLMIQLTRPKYIMPVHGDFTMRHALASTAKEIGYDDSSCIIAFDGAVTEIDENGFKIVGTIDSKPQWVEGNRVGKFSYSIVEERIKLLDEGVIVVSIKYRNDGTDYQGSDMEIISKGFFIQDDDTYLSDVFKTSLLDKLNSSFRQAEISTIKDQIKHYATDLLKEKYQKDVLVIVSVL